MMRMRREYRGIRTLLFLAVLLLGCFGLPGAALGEYGYTRVSQIPMARDFTVNVEFDEAGKPLIVTDYPFEAAGAEAMTLVYRTRRVCEAAILTYHYPAGNITCGYYSNLFDSAEDVCEKIRSGNVTLEGHVYLHSERNSEETDWFLGYSLEDHQFVEYTEKSFCDGFFGMKAGGIQKSVYYKGGLIDSMYMDKRTDAGDLVLKYNPYGEITSGRVDLSRPRRAVYHYRVSTGLFGSRPVTELGFEEADLNILPLASLSDPLVPLVETEPVEESEPVAEAPAEEEPETDAGRPSVAGGLLVGTGIGVAGYYMLRGKKEKTVR